MGSFMQIGDACCRFIDVACETKDMTEIIEASIRIKDNYSGFISTFVCLFDKKGESHTIKTVVQAEGKWNFERNPRIHGSFTIEAAINFDEFNMDCKQYQFKGNLAISPDRALSEKPLSAIDKHNHQSVSSGKGNKKFNAMMKFLNYDVTVTQGRQDRGILTRELNF